MSALFSARLRRLGVAQIRVRAIGGVARARITRLGVAFVRLSPVEIAIDMLCLREDGGYELREDGSYALRE